MMKSILDNILLFKTNIRSISAAPIVKMLLDQKASIQRWTIDTEDIDCVLRIVSNSLRPGEVIREITQLGYECAELE